MLTPDPSLNPDGKPPALVDLPLLASHSV
jgi:hypothetical protein